MRTLDTSPVTARSQPSTLPFGVQALAFTGTCWLLAAWLFLASPKAAKADDSVSYKYEDYAEADGRMKIQSQTAALEADLPADMHVKVHGVVDAIAGATPNGQPAPAGSNQVVLTTLDKRHKAWDADLSKQFKGINVEASVANSRERDYVSTGWSLNTRSDFNQNNTTLLVGAAGTDDDVQVYFQSPYAKRRSIDGIVGLTQLIDPQTWVSFDVTEGHSDGYLSDQYKLVQKHVELAPGIFLPFTYGENRPDTRNKTVLMASFDHAFTQMNGTLEGSYRFYTDTFGVDSHTFEASWLQKLGERVVLVPLLRFYTQTAADFYIYNLDNTTIMPAEGKPPSSGPFYSSDYRLSSLHSFSYALKLVVNVTRHIELDAEYRRYEMRGTDGVTPSSAYPRANILTVGGKYTF